MKGVNGMERLVKVFKALGDESRLQLLYLLLQRSYCVKALATQVQISPSAVSQHLRILKEAGLVTGNRRGYWVHYSINTDELMQFTQEVGKFFQLKEDPLRCCGRELESNMKE